MLHLRQLSAVLLPSMSRTTLMLQGSILATDRRVHHVGCSGLGGSFSSNKGAIVRSFKKCRISLSIDGRTVKSTSWNWVLWRFRGWNVHGCRFEEWTISQPQTWLFSKPPHVQKISLVCVCVWGELFCESDGFEKSCVQKGTNTQ